MTRRCKTAANHVDHASDGNQRPTGSHGTEWGANLLDTLPERRQFERRELTETLIGAITPVGPGIRRAILLRSLEERRT
jgi:hypothetical protein